MKAKGNQLKITRLYDAPVKLVWEAWTDPQQVAKWWGPRGFSITTHSKDLRAGGRWNYTMHGPDGTDYPNSTLYHEIEEHKKLVYDHGGFEDKPPLFQVCVTFNEKDGHTLMEMTMTLESPEFAQEMAKFIRQAGGNSTWDRLGEYLEGNKSFIINRAFETDAVTVFSNWDKCPLPSGFNAQIEKLEVIPNERIVCSLKFKDAANDWPHEIIAVAVFTKESSKESRVTLTWTPSNDSQEDEKKGFGSKKALLTAQWNNSFDLFEAHLES